MKITPAQRARNWAKVRGRGMDAIVIDAWLAGYKARTRFEYDRDVFRIREQRKAVMAKAAEIMKS